MFGMGMQEILVVLVVAVLVIGPDQLPKVARTMGQLMAQFKRATNDLRDAVNKEVHSHEEFKDFNDFKNTLESEVQEFHSVTSDYIHKEVEKEEGELKRAAADIQAGLDPAQDPSPDAGTDTETVVAEEPSVPPPEAHAATLEGESPSPAGESPASTEDPESPSPRKETA